MTALLALLLPIFVVGSIGAAFLWWRDTFVVRIVPYESQPELFNWADHELVETLNAEALERAKAPMDHADARAESIARQREREAKRERMKAAEPLRHLPLGP